MKSKKIAPNTKLLLFILAIKIGTLSLIYTNYLISKLSKEEHKKVELWAEAYKEIQQIDLDSEISITLFKIIQDNKTIPVILTNENDSIIAYLNIDSTKAERKNYLKKQLRTMKEDKLPIVIDYYQGQKNYIYYKDSHILTQLFYYPFIQLGVVLLFIIAAYFAFRSSRKAEENQVWVGMSKETAHQLGTPISSLIAWVEMLKMKGEDPALIAEVDKDVKRLETITERFSKIGSKPVLKDTNITQTIINSISYLKRRTSKKINYKLNFIKELEIIVPLNIALFEWVIENICKNAIDAMVGVGKISISIEETPKIVIIDITDTGKGISKRKFKKVFHPGYTSKKRGWGLGLSLAKRIINEYHQGKIFVKSSEIDKYTTFRIVLKKKLINPFHYTS